VGSPICASAIVNRLLASGQPHDARAFLDQTRDTLPAPTRDKLDQFVTAALDQHAGMSAALQAQAASSGSASNNSGGNDLAAQQHKLDTLRDHYLQHGPTATPPGAAACRPAHAL
jgi:hypothetical protein